MQAQQPQVNAPTLSSVISGTLSATTKLQDAFLGAIKAPTPQLRSSRLAAASAPLADAIKGFETIFTTAEADPRFAGLYVHDFNKAAEDAIGLLGAVRSVTRDLIDLPQTMSAHRVRGELLARLNGDAADAQQRAEFLRDVLAEHGDEAASQPLRWL